jgi:osmotically-inducible protein OsmY
MIMTDRELQRHVEDALGWEPSFDAADIGVSVDKSVVTLRGDVATYAARAAAERVALGVYGVKAVANDLNVRLGNTSAPARHCSGRGTLQWNSRANEPISVTVSNGWITLKEIWTGNIRSMRRSVQDLTRSGVNNRVIVQPRVKYRRAKQD